MPKNRTLAALQVAAEINLTMKSILVLCTGNSCRSQMAEGYLRQFAGAQAQVFSAGIEAHGLNPRAVAAMKEDGLDISHHTSNLVSEYDGKKFDYVITVCDNAREQCPYLPGVRQFHQDFPDPAKATGTEQEIAESFRKVRDQIKAYAMSFVENHLVKYGS
jgi:arsenate reductase